MIARELPPDEVLASWQHVEQRALDLRAAGVPGTLQELRMRAYLDLLQERDARTAPSTGQAGSGEPGLQDGRRRRTGTARPDGAAGTAALVPARRTARPGHPRAAPAPASPARAAAGAQPGGAGHHYRAAGDPPGPVRHPGRSRRVRAAGPRHRPGPGGRRGPQPGYSLVRDRPAPRRHRRRARLCPRPAPRPPGSAEPHVQRRHPWPLQSCPGPRRLPARPQTAAPGHRPKRSMYRPGLQPARGPLRLGPHHPLAPGGATCECNLAPRCKR